MARASSSAGTSRRIHGVVLRVLRSPEHAEEVTQDAFIYAFRNLSRFDPARPANVAPLAEMLRLNGYSTAFFGKNHETAAWEVSPSGPNTT